MHRSALTLLGTALLLSTAPATAAGQGAPTTFRPKSEATSIMYSVLGTVVPTAVGMGLASAGEFDGISVYLVLYGIYLGPATGYFYAGEAGRGARGVAVRGGITLATLLMVGAVCSGGGCNMWGDDRSMPAAGVMVLIGMAGMVGSMVYDIASAGSAARRWNARQVASKVSVAPTLDPVTASPGVAVRVQF